MEGVGEGRPGPTGHHLLLSHFPCSARASHWLPHLPRLFTSLPTLFLPPLPLASLPLHPLLHGSKTKCTPFSHPAWLSHLSGCPPFPQVTVQVYLLGKVFCGHVINSPFMFFPDVRVISVTCDCLTSSSLTGVHAPWIRGFCPSSSLRNPPGV